MFKQTLIARLVVTALALWICVHARADGVAAWPARCSAPRVGLDQLRFDFDLTDLSHIEGLDTGKLASRMAKMHVPSWWTEGPMPVSPAPEHGGERVSILVTPFPLMANPDIERLVPRGAGAGLGIVQGYLGRWHTGDSGTIMIRSAAHIDGVVEKAREEAVCITQFIAKVGLVQCGKERFAPNSTRLRELWVVGIDPIVDFEDDGNGRLRLVSSADYLAQAVSKCLDYLAEQ